MSRDQLLSATHYAIVVSQWHSTITDELQNGAIVHLKQHGIKQEHITSIAVPGAVEIPFAAQCLARSKRYQAIICLGAVIRGETDHYHYVCQQVSEGCQHVMLTYHVPVIFGILTTNSLAQAIDRVGGTHGHKGAQAAAAAIHMAMLAAELA